MFIQNISHLGFLEGIACCSRQFQVYNKCTIFVLDALKAEIAKDGEIKVSVSVTNKGTRDGKEVVQLYIRNGIRKGLLNFL